MDKPMSNTDFRTMSFIYRFRDFFNPPERFLKKVGIKPGYYVLDYGCGAGSFSIAAAKIVGKAGKVYALDINPFAIEKVKNIALKKKLKNIETISSDCKTDLPESNMDVVLLYDVFHHLNNPDKVLREIYRVLKPSGFLSFNDHHMNEDEIFSKVTNKGLFKLDKGYKKTYSFIRS
jgi:ubiquinone/menaquinone biosynthesis C-methylase UbiE